LAELAGLAERGVFDFVLLDDALEPLAPGGPPGLDAVLALARVAPATSHIGLVATATTTHTEPFHNAKNLATLDLVSGGRAGWHVATSASAESAALFGRRPPPPVDDLVEEAGDAVEVAGRLWDSWEDDAVIRDVATGRYIDRDKLHYIDFEGRFFSVRGPSITPRPPQGQVPIVVDLTDATLALAASRADLVLVSGRDLDEIGAGRRALLDAAAAAGRDPNQLTILAVATVGERARRAEFDSVIPWSGGGLDLVGDHEQVAEALASAQTAGVADGWLLRPDEVPGTLAWLVDEVAPVLQTSGAVRRAYGEVTLRERLGLERPRNRYAEVG
jgi:alkanesulfonate monooxygenase SsuD/methylene tetrahydromethanopterin reductase-like flavin-dependent oxidoreductase (luciferase family)